MAPQGGWCCCRCRRRKVGPRYRGRHLGARRNGSRSGAIRAASHQGRAAESGDCPAEGYFSDRVIHGVGEVDIPGLAYRDTDRAEKARGEDGAIGASAGLSQAGHGGDCFRGRDAANQIVGAIGNVNIRRAIDGHAPRSIESSHASDAIVSPELAGETGERADGACGCHFSNRVIEGIGDVDVPASVDRDSSRSVEACDAPGAVVAAGIAR